MIGVERIDRHRDRATDKESCIDRHPRLAAVAGAKRAAPCARIVCQARLHKSNNAKHDEADAQHRSFLESGFAKNAARSRVTPAPRSLQQLRTDRCDYLGLR